MNILDDVVYNFISPYNGKQYNFKEVTTNSFGTAMTNTDVDGCIYVKNNTTGKFYKNTEEVLDITMWGAKGDGTTDNTAAFTACNNSVRKLKYKKPVLVPSGVYKVTGGPMVIDGGGQGNAPYYIGSGGRSTVIDATTVVGNTAVRFGNNGTTNSTWGDTLHGGLKGVKIIGRSDVDALVIASYAPTSNASCVFEDIYISGCRDGINSFMNASNTTSNYRNRFTNIHIEKYYRNALHVRGVYSTYEDIFIVQPSGETSVATPDPTKGALTLAMLVEGDDNTFINIQTEDQISVPGRDNVFINMSIEYIKKGQAHAGIGGTALRVAGPSNMFLKFKMVGIRKAVINQLGAIFSESIMLMNFSYYDGFGGDPAYIPDYPIVPQPGSSGIMQNMLLSTGFHIDNASFAAGRANWRFINHTFIGDTLNLVLPNYLDADKGGLIPALTKFAQLEMADNLSTAILRGIVYELGALHYIEPTAGASEYLQFITSTIPGTRNLSNLLQINFSQSNLPPDFPDDVNASAGGVAVGRVYRTGNVLKVRIA